MWSAATSSLLPTGVGALGPSHDVFSSRGKIAKMLAPAAQRVGRMYFSNLGQGIRSTSWRTSASSCSRIPLFHGESRSATTLLGSPSTTSMQSPAAFDHVRLVQLGQQSRSLQLGSSSSSSSSSLRNSLEVVNQQNKQRSSAIASSIFRAFSTWPFRSSVVKKGPAHTQPTPGALPGITPRQAFGNVMLVRKNVKIKEELLKPKTSDSTELATSEGGSSELATSEGTSSAVTKKAGERILPVPHAEPYSPPVRFRSYNSERYNVYKGRVFWTRVWAVFLISLGTFWLWYAKWIFVHTVNMRGNPARLEDPSLIWVMRVLFGPARSRFAKYLSEVRLPHSWRVPLYSLFARIYDVNLDECRYPLDSYACFQEFFSRSLNDGVFTVDEHCPVVSPVDARLVACGEITETQARIPQVKGANYDITAFLGTDPYRNIIDRRRFGKPGERYGGVRMHSLGVEETRDKVDEIILEAERKEVTQRVIRQRPPLYNFTKEDVDAGRIEFHSKEHDTSDEESAEEKEAKIARIGVPGLMSRQELDQGDGGSKTQSASLATLVAESSLRGTEHEDSALKKKQREDAKKKSFFNSEFHQRMEKQFEEEQIRQKEEAEAQRIMDEKLAQMMNEAKKTDGVKLVYCVLYLAPGDYHRFHSPVGNFRVDVGRHYPGEFFPVNPAWADRVPDLFTCNERVVLSGSWTPSGGGSWRTSEDVDSNASTTSTTSSEHIEDASSDDKRNKMNLRSASTAPSNSNSTKSSPEHLAMHMTAVAAYNVGGIWLDFDNALRTNNDHHAPFELSNMVTSKEFSCRWGGWSKFLKLDKGDLVGGFKMGSTIVLVFECPEEYEWKCKEGEKIRVGQPLMGY
ncbi:unnamed protein product [Amoebophrya sp. A25]|nr:unnamed protein product [Amoebophrya sp. A25]|eukprot:GSA25T00001670001.1